MLNQIINELLNNNYCPDKDKKNDQIHFVFEYLNPRKLAYDKKIKYSGGTKF